MKIQNEFPLYFFEITWINMFHLTFSDHYIRIFFKIRAKLKWLMTYNMLLSCYYHVTISDML